MNNLIFIYNMEKLTEENVEDFNIDALYDTLSKNKQINKDKLNNNKLKKEKIKSKIMNLYVCENTKNKLIENMNKNICLDSYENHIDKLKNLKLTRYSDG